MSRLNDLCGCECDGDDETVLYHALNFHRLK